MSPALIIMHKDQVTQFSSRDISSIWSDFVNYDGHVEVVKSSDLNRLEPGRFFPPWNQASSPPPPQAPRPANPMGLAIQSSWDPSQLHMDAIRAIGMPSMPVGGVFPSCWANSDQLGLQNDLPPFAGPSHHHHQQQQQQQVHR